MTDVAVRSGVARLTPKEQACLHLVARHMSSKEIAAELGIAKTSVDTYCNRAREKLGVVDRYEAARLVVSRGDADQIFAAMERKAATEPPKARGLEYLGLSLGLLAALALGLATLLAGLRALDVMKPLPSHSTVAHAPAQASASH